MEEKLRLRIIDPLELGLEISSKDIPVLLDIYCLPPVTPLLETAVLNQIPIVIVDSTCKWVTNYKVVLSIKKLFFVLSIRKQKFEGKRISVIWLLFLLLGTPVFLFHLFNQNTFSTVLYKYFLSLPSIFWAFIANFYQTVRLYYSYDYFQVDFYSYIFDFNCQS